MRHFLLFLFLLYERNINRPLTLYKISVNFVKCYKNSAIHQRAILLYRSMIKKFNILLNGTEAVPYVNLNRNVGIDAFEGHWKTPGLCHSE